MTVHLISVGLQVIERLRDPREVLKNAERDLRDAVRKARGHELLDDIPEHGRDRASAWLKGALAPTGSADRDDGSADRFAAAVAGARASEWPPGLSAELDTFARMADLRYPIPPDSEDITLLISSDTRDGLLAAAWNAAALAGGDLDRVRYLSAPDNVTSLGNLRGRVVIARVPGMDAGDERGFREAMGGLGALAAELFRSAGLTKTEPFRFYLSGGYKASIPYLIGMAEAIRSVDQKRLDEFHAGGAMPKDGSPYPVEAFVLHESANRTAPPIRLPLRRLYAEVVREELSGFGAADFVRREKGIPEPGMLLGYAYEIQGSRAASRAKCELTAFGAGLREFFGVPSEGYGG